MKEIKQLDNAHEFTKLPNSWEEKGRREGRDEGKREGIKEGMSAGKKEGMKEVALEMLKEGASIEFIAKVTKLNWEEIEQLKKSAGK